MQQQPDETTESVIQRKRVEYVKEVSRAARAMILALIIQSLLQTIIDVFLPEQSKFKILYWGLLLLLVSVFFAFIDSSLTLVERIFLFPLIRQVKKPWIDPKETVPLVTATSSPYYAAAATVSRAQR